ncbi:MAG: serine hydrolase domain-containing protein [Anaerolineae bacterium]
MPSFTVRLLRLLCLLLSVLVLAACVRPRTPTPTPTPSRPGVTVTSLSPSATATVAPATAAAPTEAPTPDALARAVDAYLSAEAAAGRFSGAVLIGRQGRVVFEAGYGYANRTAGVPNRPQTRFCIASVTKPFTAAAILQLQERGKLRLSDSIAAYLPDCPPAWRTITIEQLLTHTAGLDDYFYLPAFDSIMGQATTPGGLMSLFRDRPLNSSPGERFAYSNSGYVLLGQIIEEVSGERYGRYISDNILQPAGMGASTYGRSLAADTATGYAVAWKPALQIDVSLAYAAGGLYSTVEDLYTWEQALCHPGLLSQTSLDALFQPRVKVPTRKDWYYGYGWFVRSRGGIPEVFHPGLLYGYSAHIARYPTEGLTIIMLCNLEEAPLADYVDWIAGQMLE